MGRKSHVNSFIGKIVGGLLILNKTTIQKGRQRINCKCLNCQKEFETIFHNVYLGQYKSCGCLKHAFQNKNPRWKGYGEISKSVLYSLQKGAKQRNLNFNVSIQEIWLLFLRQNRKCLISGLPLKFPLSRSDTNATASLDRIDSSKGYTIDNIQWLHKKVNYMKQSMGNQEFLDWIKIIYHQNFQKNE